ncbi:MAG: tetratricopeptide repeat-containing sensor histidine kinase, partial [Cyclobacteriaceae bacterium]
LKCKNQDLVSNAYNPLSGILMKSGKKDEAIEMIEKSISIKKETGDIRGLAFAIYGRGKIHARLEQFEKAEADYNEALRIHIESGEKLGATMVQRKMAALYFQMGLLERAKETANLCLQSSGENNIALIKSDTYYLLYQISKIENDLENALNYLEAYTREKERIISERHHKMIKSYEITNRINTLEIEAESQREKAEIIEKKNQELDLFFHRVSHDLKGPIASLVSIDYVARSEIKDGKVHHFLDLARTQTTRINLILDELIKLTRVTHSTDAHEAIDFDKLISQCLMSFGSLPNFEKVRIEKSVASDLDFHAPWALVNTIVQNLLENGIKYARLDQEESFVKIKVSNKMDQIEIVVQDNGVGMRKDTGEKIFEMFYRAEKDIQGSGLGLYILNRAVEKLDGTISLESEPNVGSTFNVKLPKKQSL